MLTVKWTEGEGFCNFSKSFRRYWGHAGLFFKGRNPDENRDLPQFIERRISLKIHLRTAP